MKNNLIQKLNNPSPFTDAELKWCLENIGHPSPEIRDQLVYMSFGISLEKELINPSQFNFLSNYLIKNELLKSNDSLTRSFSALLASLLLAFDNWEESLYFNKISEDDRKLLFQMAKSFLSEEKDNRGYDEKLGWIHNIAHGCEFLLAASIHSKFPKEKLMTIWQVIIDLFKKQNNVFSAGEDERFAHLISQLIYSKKLSQETLANWIEKEEFPDIEPVEYFQSLNFKHFLSQIYLNLEKENILKSCLKSAILSKI